MPSLVLVTGSAGKLGRAAVAALLEAGHAVRGFDRVPTPGLPSSLAVVGELTDAVVVQEALAGVETVIHLAACPDDARFPRGDAPDDGDNFLSELVPANVVGLYHVLEAARKHKPKRLILASTAQVVEGHIDAGNTPTTVTAQPRPRYLYACTKVFLEACGRVYAEQHGLNVLAVRLGWCPRTPEHVAAITADSEAQDAYLSEGDAGRFFVAAANAAYVGYHVVYCMSRPVRHTLYDLEPTRKLVNWAPTECWRES